jgi:hypothetical protein
MDVQPDALQRIAIAVTPAVMLSACGLIALGLDNQVSRMSARLRELVREHRDPAATPARRDLVARQVAAFDERHLILTRALQLDYGALLAFVLTSFLELSAGLVPTPRGLSLLVFAAGVVMLGGMATFVLMSLGRARAALTLEQEGLDASRDAPAARGARG